MEISIVAPKETRHYQFAFTLSRVVELATLWYSLRSSTQRFTSLAHLITHFRVVAALVLREMEARFGNKPGGYIWALLDPAAQVLMMTVIFGAIGRMPALGTSFPLFFASGYLAFGFYAGVSTYVVSSVQANKSLLSYPIVAPIDTVAARFILQFITSIVVTIVIISIASAESFTTPKFNLPILVASAFMGSLLGLGMGLVNITLFSRYSLYSKVFALVNRPLYLISGVFFLPDDMPHPLREVILFNPIAHLIMWFRSGFYSEYAPEGLDKAYVIESSMVLIFIGLALLSISNGHLRNDMS